MGFCKEIETCRPFDCHVPCQIGEDLRKLGKSPKCGKEICLWIKNGINGINGCKESCRTGDAIEDQRRKLIREKR